MAGDGEYNDADQSTNTNNDANGETARKERGGENNSSYTFKNGGESESESYTLYGVVSSILSSIFSPDPNTALASASFFHRIRVSLRHNLPHLPEASRTSLSKLLRWARRGSPLRLLLVISVGTITLLTLTGILVFLLFLGAATVNAIIISLFVSLATAGGFLAMFFASVAVIYIGALSVAAFVISSATISAIITAIIVTGWIGFFLTIWVALKKSAGLAKYSIGATGSALSTWQAQRRRHNHD